MFSLELMLTDTQVCLEVTDNCLTNSIERRVENSLNHFLNMHIRKAVDVPYVFSVLKHDTVDLCAKRIKDSKQ